MATRDLSWKKEEEAVNRYFNSTYPSSNASVATQMIIYESSLNDDFAIKNMITKHWNKLLHC